MQSAGPEREKYNFRKFPLLVVTLTKQGVLVSNSKAWSTLYNQCIRQSVNRYGKKKELVSTVLLTPSILHKVSQVSHRVLLQELRFTTTFNVILVLYLFFVCLFVCLFCFLCFALLPFVQRLIQELRLPFLSLKK